MSARPIHQELDIYCVYTHTVYQPAGWHSTGWRNNHLNKLGNSLPEASLLVDIVPTEKMGWLVRANEGSSTWLRHSGTIPSYTDLYYPIIRESKIRSNVD